MALKKIVSGGQTGVDRAALDVAIFLEIEHGGWCPKGRRAEDGRIPNSYQMSETESRDYAVRTERNVIDSDATLILYRDQTVGGTELTRRMALKHQRPYLCLDLAQWEITEETETLEGAESPSAAEDGVPVGATDPLLDQLNQWLGQSGFSVLNIAGPRESTCPGIAKQSERFLSLALQAYAEWRG